MDKEDSVNVGTEHSGGVAVESERQLQGQPGFTPGSWEVKHADTKAEWDVVTSDGFYIATTFEMFGLNDRNETLDNARLIAAAPALYAALANLAFSYADRDKGNGCWCSIRGDETHFERTGAHDVACQAARAAFVLATKP